MFLIGQIEALINIITEEQKILLVEYDKDDLQKEKEQIMKYQGITIHKNKNCTTWYTRFRKNGKQIYISARTQKDCFNKLKQALKQDYNQIETYTLYEWYLKWIQLYKQNVKTETIRDYNNLIKNLNSITNIDINKISVEQILNILNNMSAERQKQKVYELLSMLFKKALDNEIINKNIMTRIDKPKHNKENGKALTHAQESEFINQCQKIKYGDLYLVALYQGLRKGEILGITREDIDFENNTLNINKAINRHNQFDTTKNEFSKRVMPLFEKSKEILLKYKNEKGRIFNISYHRIDDYTKLLNNKLSFSFSIKYMRFTFITRCQESNIPEFIIQAWCGHQIGSKVTKSVYTKFNQEDNTKYINILNSSKFYSNSTQQ